jgi:hypothetical protein
MRIAAITASELWTGAEQEHIHLALPHRMNLETEEKLWFKAGGGTVRQFADFLIAKGAQEVSVLTWYIGYQS